MTETATEVARQPLHGDLVTGVRITPHQGKRTLIKRFYATGLPVHERVRAGIHTDYPGIEVVDLFVASGTDHNLAPNLEQAIACNPHYQRFLVSYDHQEQLAIVTSRIGCLSSGNVRSLPPPPYMRSELKELGEVDVNMYDCSQSMASPALTQKHLGRAAVFGLDATKSSPRNQLENVFRYIMSCAPEINHP